MRMTRRHRWRKSTNCQRRKQNYSKMRNSRMKMSCLTSRRRMNCCLMR